MFGRARVTRLTNHGEFAPSISHTGRPASGQRLCHVQTLSPPPHPCSCSCSSKPSFYPPAVSICPREVKTCHTPISREASIFRMAGCSPGEKHCLVKVKDLCWGGVTFVYEEGASAQQLCPHPVSRAAGSWKVKGLAAHYSLRSTTHEEKVERTL